MIELASAVWKIPTYDTVKRLHREGLQLDKEHRKRTAVQKYVDTRQVPRARVDRMWDKAQAAMEKAPSPGICNLQRQFHLQLRGSRDRWRAGPGQLFGALPVREIEPVFTPSLSSQDDYGRTKQRGVFSGQSWDEALVVPFYDLPHRIRSFAFLGRSGRPAVDQVFKTTSQGGNINPEAGIGCLPAIEMAGDPATVIASNDWLLALRAHMRTFKSSWAPMPLVVWMDNGTHRTLQSWNILGDRRIVFWQFHMDAQLVRQAVYTDGHISLLGPKTVVDDKAVGHFFRDNLGTDLRRSIEKSARPWRKAVAHWMACNCQSVVSQLLRDLEELGEDVSYILRQCGKSNVTTNRPIVRRQVLLSSRTFVERGDTWYTEDSRGNLFVVNDAPFVFTHAIRDSASGDLFHRGYVRYKGSRVHFIEADKTVTKSTLMWLRDKVARAGLGLVECQRKWSSQLYDVAVAFETPQFVDDDLANHVHELREQGLLEDPI